MISYLLDPVFRAPLIASMLMCLSSSLMGVLIFLKKRALLSETLSHATYPGVAIALLVGSFFFQESSFSLLLLGAFLSSSLAYFLFQFFQKRGMKEDSALTFVLSSFFGFGVLLSSLIQSKFPEKWKNISAYLFGNVSTLTDEYTIFYSLFALLIVLCLILFFKEIQLFLFDKNFHVSRKTVTVKIERFFVLLVIVTIVISLRSVGLILISAMLIAPSTFARCFTDNLKVMFLLAGSIAVISAFIGNLLSFSSSLPSGSTIVCVACCFAFYALLFAPKRGLVVRYLRSFIFQMVTLKENLLKALWRAPEKKSSLKDLKALTHFSSIILCFALLQLIKRGEIKKEKNVYLLTSLGEKRGAKIIRLHRLWEVYLVNYLGIPVRRVHKSAEEIEHIINRDLEKALTELLDDPLIDPHNQPIPPSEESYA